MKWISTEDRLPKSDEFVLAKCIDRPLLAARSYLIPQTHLFVVAKYNKDLGKWQSCSCTPQSTLDRVIFWCKIEDRC